MTEIDAVVDDGDHDARVPSLDAQGLERVDVDVNRAPDAIHRLAAVVEAPEHPKPWLVGDVVIQLAPAVGRDGRHVRVARKLAPGGRG